jgi:hypothetical protein
MLDHGERASTPGRGTRGLFMAPGLASVRRPAGAALVIAALLGLAAGCRDRTSAIEPGRDCNSACRSV